MFFPSHLSNTSGLARVPPEDPGRGWGGGGSMELEKALEEPFKYLNVFEKDAAHT